MFSSVTVFAIIAFVIAMSLQEKADKVGRTLLSAICACITAFVMVLLSILVMRMAPSTSPVAEYDKVEIVALSASSSVEGDFFLGSGRIEGRPYYFFYFATPDGGKKLSKLNADNVTLYEEDRKGAFMAKVENKKEWNGHDWLFNFFVPQFLWDGDQHIQYAIHIPKGSIKEDINLDLPR